MSAPRLDKSRQRIVEARENLGAAVLLLGAAFRAARPLTLDELTRAYRAVVIAQRALRGGGHH